MVNREGKGYRPPSAVRANPQPNESQPWAGRSKPGRHDLCVCGHEWHYHVTTLPYTDCNECFDPPCYTFREIEEASRG